MADPDRIAFGQAFLSWNGFHTEAELDKEWERGSLAGEMFREGLKAARRAVPAQASAPEVAKPTPCKPSGAAYPICEGAPTAVLAGLPIHWMEVGKGACRTYFAVVDVEQALIAAPAPLQGGQSAPGLSAAERAMLEELPGILEDDSMAHLASLVRRLIAAAAPGGGEPSGRAGECRNAIINSGAGAWPKSCRRCGLAKNCPDGIVANFAAAHAPAQQEPTK